MAKKVTGSVDLPPAVRTFVGFEPTPFQQRVKSAFWSKFADDPLVSPEHLRGSEAAALAKEPELERWFQDEHFSKWFRNKDQFKQDVEHLLDEWTAQMRARLLSGLLGDREFLQLGKLLSELSPRARASKAPEAPELEGFSPEKMRRLVEDEARRMGWLPPSPQKELL